MPVRPPALVLLLVAVGLPPVATGQAPPAAPAAAAAPDDVYERLYVQGREALAARAGRPEAVAPLAALVGIEDYLPQGRLGPLLGEVARGGHPLVAAQASYLLALADARTGDFAAADRRFRALGLVDAWTVVGPFEAQGRGGLDRAFPPEQPGGEPRAGRRFPGKEREVAWRSGAGVQRLGALALDGLLRPDSDAVAYALTYLRSDRRRPVVLRLGSPGPVRVWVRGKPVLERNVIREARLDQDAAAVVLEPGDNAVLVKTVVTSGAWRLYLRVTDPAGNPVPAVGARPEGGGPLAPPARAEGAAPARPRGETRAELGALLQARAERTRGKDAGEAWLDYGRWLAFSRAPDREGKQTEATLERAVAAGAGAPALLLLGERAVEDDDRQRALERVAAATADRGLRALALAGLGDIARGRRRSSAAVDLYRRALAEDPGCLPAVLALAADEQLVGLPAMALGRLDALPAAARTSFRLRMARARALEAVGRRTEAEAELRAAFAGRRTDIDLALDLARQARQRGDLDEAIRLHRQAVEQRPELSFLPAEWARLLEGKGDRAAAERALAEAAARLPDEPALHEELGRLLVRGGQLPAGLVELRRALELRPQNPTLRRYLARLTSEAADEGGRGGQGAGDLARAFAEDTAPLARAALADPPAGRPPERAGTVVLLDNQAVRVHRNGLAERFTQRLVQVRTEQAAREQTEMYVRYTPGSQEVEIRKAQVYRRVAPDGGKGKPGEPGDLQVLQATGRDDRDLSEPWYGLYYDVRADVVQFEGLRPGDVIDLQYTVSDVSSENAFGGYFGDVEFIAETSPRRRWQYVLLAPPERTLYFNEPRVAGLVRRQEKRGDEVMYQFAARDIPRIEAEPGMPGWGEVAPYLHVSSYRSWQEVGRWYWNLIADQLAADEAIRKAAAAATKGARTLADKVRGVHRFVLDNTRYVALEFGIHGYKPYKVSQVLSRRFGDCKDKAALLLVLLREAGVEAEIVLLRTRRNGRVTSNPASLAVFDHAIAYVPALSLYLDGTAEFSGTAELPAEDQGATALRVSARGVELVETPVLPARDNRADRRWVAELEPGGGARVEEVVTVSGQAAPEWREHYQTPGERQERLGKVWSARFPGAVVDEVTVDGTEDRNQPVVARSVAHLPRLAEPVGDRVLRLPVTTREADFVQTYARLSRRKHSYLMGYPWQHDEELRFRLPEGWHVASLPDPREARSQFGRFRLEIRAPAPGQGGGREGREVREVVVRSQIEVTQHLVPPGDYPAFRAFLGTLDGALRQTLVLERER
jgi:cellulose synthase operon protein C